MNYLKRRREELGLTQKVVAQQLRKAEPRLDSTMISRYECGLCNPTPGQAQALTTVLQAPLGELYDRRDLDYGLEERVEKRKENRRRPFRVVGRLSEAEHAAFAAAMRTMGHNRVNDAVVYMVRRYIKNAKRREQRGQVHLQRVRRDV